MKETWLYSVEDTNHQRWSIFSLFGSIFLTSFSLSSSISIPHPLSLLTGSQHLAHTHLMRFALLNSQHFKFSLLAFLLANVLQEACYIHSKLLNIGIEIQIHPRWCTPTVTSHFIKGQQHSNPLCERDYYLWTIIWDVCSPSPVFEELLYIAGPQILTVTSWYQTRKLATLDLLIQPLRWDKSPIHIVTSSTLKNSWR